jgi:plastocyanin
MCLSALLSLVVFATGCGEPGAVKAKSQTVEIKLENFRFRPQNVRVRAGEVTFVLKNSGRVGHNFRMRNTKIVAMEVPTIRPGEKVVAKAKLAAGWYTIASTANPRQLGMVGKIIVEKSS